jgi:two-component system, cell cycle sensor histidine kinase and response regulator CckA
MNREPLRVLNLEADDEDHQRVRLHAASGTEMSFERAANRAEFEAALKRGVDLILADYFTPGFDGMAALEAALLLSPGTPFIAVADTVGEEGAVALVRRGASDFVHKGRLERLPAAIALARRGPPSPRGSAAEERFSEMAENIRDVFWVCAADTGRVLYVSPAYEGIWGRPPETLLAADGGWPDAVHGEDAAGLKEARGQLALGLPYQIEYRIQRPDASVRWIHDRGFPVPVKDGVPARWVGVAADITDRKRLEGDLLQAQKMELVGKLAGGIAHDFNNLLTIISGYVSMLLDKETMQPKSVEALKRVFTASRQATGLVRQLLLFSRKRAPKPEIVDLNQEVEVMAEMLRRLLGENVAVEFQASDDIPWANVDVSMLEQVLMNLAVNARDAMQAGGKLGISVGILRNGSGVQKDPARPGDHAFIALRDTGSGIPPAILPRIFEPFFTTKNEGRGTGLGLATAMDIVKRHDGWIEVETELGVGTVFRIFLPLAHVDEPAAAAPETPRGPRATKGTILLVEDETNVREFAAAVLQQEGYTLLQAKSAENALEVWQWHSARVDLLLTDVVLPGELSGIDLGDSLQEERPTLKVVLTTGYSRESVTPRAGGKPLFVLSKPYTPRALLQAVHDALAR